MGKNAAQARNNDKRAAKHHDRLGGEAIRYGPIHEERRAQAQKIDGNRQTHVRRRRTKIGPGGRQARQDHVDAEGWQGRQKTQQQRKNERDGKNDHGYGSLSIGVTARALRTLGTLRGVGEGRRTHHAPGAACPANRQAVPWSCLLRGCWLAQRPAAIVSISSTRLDRSISALIASPTRRAASLNCGSVSSRFIAAAISTLEAIGGKRSPVPFASTRTAFAAWSRAIGRMSCGRALSSECVTAQ